MRAATLAFQHLKDKTTVEIRVSFARILASLGLWGQAWYATEASLVDSGIGVEATESKIGDDILSAIRYVQHISQCDVAVNDALRVQCDKSRRHGNEKSHSLVSR